MRKIFTLTFLLVTAVMGLQAQIVFQEDFEAGFAGWTAENIWTHGDVTTNASQYYNMGDHTLFMAANDDAAGNGVNGSGRLISPPIDLTGGITNPFLVFESFFVNLDFQGNDETAKVFISKDNGSNWDEAKNLAGSTAGWTKERVNLIDYVGNTILIAFDYQDAAVWNYGFSVDDVMVFQPKAVDAEMTTFNPKRFERTNLDVPVSLQITNVGYETITELEISWTDGTNTYTDMLTGISIAPFATLNHNHSTSFSGGTDAKQYDLRVWTSNPNAQLDDDPTNDEVTRSVSFIANPPTKKVVAEEATGTWCPWCPRGDVFMEQMTDAYPEAFIGIAVHNNDPMDIGPYDAALGDFPGFSGYPSVIVNRNTVIDPSDLPSQMAPQQSLLTPLTVGGVANFDDDTRELSIRVSVETYTQIIDGDLRVSAVITEDGVTGSGGAYAQANNYAGGGNGPMGGYENLPNPVPANQMVYNHVARELIGGWAGDAILPATMENGSVGEAQLSYTVPSSINERNMHVIVMVTDPVTSEIYNAESMSPTGIYPLFNSAVTRGCGPFTTTFNDNSDTTTTRLWTFEGGTPATSTEKNPTVTFDNPGKYNVTLEVTTDLGNDYTIDLPDYITVDQLPTADFLFSIANDEVTFDNETANGFSYLWDFGDGNTSGTPNPTHTYAASGTYTVTLTARNGTCEDVTTQEITFILTGLEDVLQDDWAISANPNPFTDVMSINYNLDIEGTQSQLVVYNYLGQTLLTQDLNTASGTVELGAELSEGIYFVQIRQDLKLSKLVKVTKIR